MRGFQALPRYEAIDETLHMVTSGRSSHALARKVFLNGLAFFAVMLAMSLTIAWHLSQVTAGSLAIMRGVEHEVRVAYGFRCRAPTPCPVRGV